MRRAGTFLLRLLELVLYLFAALVLAWLTWQEVEVRWTLEHHGRRAEATIVSHAGGSTKTGVVYRPVLRFTTAEGRRVRATAGGAGTKATETIPIGTVVEAVYDPADPRRVFTAAELARVGWLLALLPGGAVVLAVLGLFAVRLREHLRALRRAAAPGR